jgi:hypothetical protein
MLVRAARWRHAPASAWPRDHEAVCDAQSCAKTLFASKSRPKILSKRLKFGFARDEDFDLRCVYSHS